MGRCHKLGQSWVPEDGIVREANAGDVEVDQLGAVVVPGTEGDRKAYLPRGLVDPGPTPEKGLVGRSRPCGT